MAPDIREVLIRRALFALLARLGGQAILAADELNYYGYGIGMKQLDGDKVLFQAMSAERTEELVKEGLPTI